MGTEIMLKPLALTLLVATFLASGFTLVPAETVTSLNRTETFTSENLKVVPVADEELASTQSNSGAKTDREDIPKT